MLSTSGLPRTLSDATMRSFLLAQLDTNQQSQFEAALLSNPHFESRLRLAEIELLDDYAGDRLNAKERNAFQTKFLVTDARRRKLAVAMALHDSFGNREGSESSSARLVFPWPRLAWRIAFAVLTVAVLVASAWVIRKEPQVVERFIPKPLRPRPVAPRTPQAAHHPANPSEPSTHREESPSLPGHEASPQAIVLRADVTADNAPPVELSPQATRTLRIELLLQRNESAIFSVSVANDRGEVVYELPDINGRESGLIAFDLPVEKLNAGVFQITATRAGDPSPTSRYYLRIK